MMIKRVEVRERFMARLTKESDLLEEITDICRKHGVTLGRVEALGAVQKGMFFVLRSRGLTNTSPCPWTAPQILKLDGERHLARQRTFCPRPRYLGADAEGRAYGGHLAPGTIIFACECFIEAFDGPALTRELDPATDLFLWGTGE